MNKKAFSAAAVAGVLLFGGCDKPSNNAQPGAETPKSSSSSLTENKPSPENTVLIINGKPVSKALFQSIIAELAQRSGGQNIPEEKVLDGLVARELLYQEAEKLNLANDPAIAAKLDKSRQDVLVQAEVEHFRKTATVSDEELKKEYDTRIASMAGGTEYKARHILLDSEETAKDVLAKLQKGGKFDELAKKLSKDPSVKQNGGELGWFSPQQMVPEFSAAVANLKNGELAQAPVKSKFGWHVIQREESRGQTAPPFDAVKEHLRAMVLAQKLQKHVEEMKASAKIERLAPPAEPPKAQATPPASPMPSGPVSAADKPVKSATPAVPTAPAQPPAK